MTHQRTLTAAHWGVYEVEYDEAGNAKKLHPFSKDPDPSPIGLHMLSDEVARLRVRRPAFRKSWLEHGPGANSDKRGREPFVEVPWDEALDLVAGELKRVKDAHSNRAIFGGSYGWSSAGRFHHAQSQVHRFLNALGGYVRHQDSYSLGAARVLMPHIVASMEDLMAMHTTWETLAEHCKLFVTFGGAPHKNAQISAGGAMVHRLKDGLYGMRAKGVRFINITPTAEDLDKEPLKKLGSDVETVETALRKSFVDYLENGGGVVCLHYAIAANRHWPEWKELMGATFTGHPWTEEVGVTVEEPDHPLVAAFGGQDFRITDEIYAYGPPYDRSQLRVLMSLDPATTNMGVRWLNRQQDDFALTWVKSHGQGRIFNTSFGHMANLYSNPQTLQFYLDAIQFATGDLEAPTAPRASRPERKNVPGTQPAPGLEEGFLALFDGHSLDGWQGDRTIWSVQDGAITGQTTADTGLKENNFLLWKDQVENFELRLKFRLENGNSGIYYRARQRRPNQTEGDPLVGMQDQIARRAGRTRRESRAG